MGVECYLSGIKLMRNDTETGVSLVKDVSKAELTIAICQESGFTRGEIDPDVIVPLNEKDLGVDFKDVTSEDWKPFFRTNGSKVPMQLYFTEDKFFLCQSLEVFRVKPTQIRIKHKYGNSRKHKNIISS